LPRLYPLEAAAALRHRKTRESSLPDEVGIESIEEF